MADWRGDSLFSSPYSGAFSHTSSSFSEVEEALEDRVDGLPLHEEPATNGKNNGIVGSRRVVFYEPPVPKDDDDIEEIDDPDLPMCVTTAKPMYSTHSGAPVATAYSTSPAPTAAPAEQPMEPRRTPGPEPIPGPPMPRVATIPVVISKQHCRGRSQSPTSAAERSVTSPEICRMPAITAATPPTSVARQRRQIASERFSLRRPVNEKAASEARAHTSQSSAAMLATYRTIKRNTQTRLYRRYYDKWLLLIARAPAVFARTDSASSRQARATQTDILLNEDVELYEGDVLLSTTSDITGDRVMVLSTDCMGCDEQESGVGTYTRASPSPEVPSLLPTARPLFHYSPAPPVREGIAAKTRPAARPDDVGKADLPGRKGLSPSRNGLHSTELPAVVAHPIRVHRL